MVGWGPLPEADECFREAHTVFDRITRMETRVMSFCSNEKPEIILKEEETFIDETVNSNGWSKSRMWSQYGENHKGICLVFSKKAIEDEFISIRERLIAKNVRYNAMSEQYIPASAYTLDKNQLVGQGVEDYSFTHIKNHADTLFFTKNIDYRDEGEYRVVVFDADNE